MIEIAASNTDIILAFEALKCTFFCGVTLKTFLFLCLPKQWMLVWALLLGIFKITACLADKILTFITLKKSFFSNFTFNAFFI